MVDGTVACIEKICTVCEERKEIIEFTWTARDGRLARCKSCCLEEQREWRRVNPGKAKENRARAFKAWRIKHPKLPPREPIVSENGRLCRTCETRKDSTCFSEDRRSRDGLAWRCRNCAKRAHAKWSAENIEHVRDGSRKTQRQAYAANPEKLKAMLRRSRLRTKYGMTLEELASMIAAQDGGCKICRKLIFMWKPDGLSKGNVACIDHDHVTGVIRGVLCNHCNRAIGLLGDSSEKLLLAAKYLKEFGL